MTLVSCTPSIVEHVAFACSSILMQLSATPVENYGILFVGKLVQLIDGGDSFGNTGGALSLLIAITSIEFDVFSIFD